MAAPRAAAPSWRTKLPFHCGNPQQREQRQQGYAGKQSLVEPAVSNPTFEKQSSSCHGPRKAQKWLLSDDRTFSFSKPSSDDGDDETQTIVTSMVAHAASTAYSEVTDDHGSVATPDECASDQVYIVENGAANDDTFRGIGDCFDGPKLNGQLFIHLALPFDRDTNIEDGRHWKGLADKQDEASEYWGRTGFEAPRTSSPFEPVPSLATDCSTVESETIATHQYPTGASALPLNDQRAQPPKHRLSTTNKPVGFEEAEKEGALPFRIQEVPLGIPTQHTGQRGGRHDGDGGSRGGGRGGTTSSSTSHAHAASFDSSSSKATGELKRRRQDDDPEENNQGNRELSKRSKPNGAEKRRLACPFLRRDPKKYFHCIHYHLKTTGDLKQHLKRCHFAPIHCPRCGEVFTSRALSDEHIIRVGCQETVITTYDIDEGTQQRLEGSLRDPDESVRWFLIWDILFPDMTCQRPPSPFQLDPWQEIWAIVCGKLRQDSTDLTTTFVGNGCSPAAAQAIIRELEIWAQRNGEATIYGSPVFDEPSRPRVVENSGAGDSTDQSSNNTTSVDVQVDNSNPQHELIPATGPTGVGSPNFLLYLPSLGIHDYGPWPSDFDMDEFFRALSER
ncbi:HET and ankyrin domain protein [Colletotrichum tofieldiae]|nr:HET and ankyrin domain protein [Colletotrichum tofieldiae]GKT80609.1 HET and ankyrin domain protein [Colletotrichum tofieldiae]